MITGIYAIQDSCDGSPVYVGRAVDVERRIAQHHGDWRRAIAHIARSLSRQPLEKEHSSDWGYEYLAKLPMRSKQDCFNFLVASGRTFQWSVLEECDKKDLELRERMLIKAYDQSFGLSNGLLNILQTGATKNWGHYTTRYVHDCATLRRLRKDAPELHRQVVAGELSANAAAIQAGFRRPMRSVPVDNPRAFIAAGLRVFTLDELREAVASYDP